MSIHKHNEQSDNQWISTQTESEYQEGWSYVVQAYLFYFFMNSMSFKIIQG